MTIATTAMRLATVTMLAASVTAPLAAPTFAAETQKKEEVRIDRRATGSIGQAETRDCTGNENRFVCRVTGGNRDIAFPPAPLNPAFGF
jgi:hypothetical protein